MKTYGQKETIDDTILKVDTDHDAVVGMVVQNDDDFLITLLDLDEVEDMLIQLTKWLATQKKGLRA